jgi:hypothetical protein
MDILLESGIFLCRRDTESISAGLAARAQKLIGNMSCFVPLSPQVPGLGTRCNKEVFAIWKPRSSRIAVWFVAAGVLTAESVM